MAATIEMRDLAKAYDGRVVVDKLNLSIEEGEVFGLLGPNGAGKTTTILMLLGLTEPTSGQVRVLGFDPARRSLEVKRRVGYLPDAVGFYETLTGRDNLLFTARLNGLAGQEAHERVDALLAEVGLAEAADQLAGEYSRGMLQRLGIADALVKDPRILILDEPTTAIDPEGVAEVLGLIRRLADERGVTILLSSHLLNQVQAVCHRVAIFVEGKVLASGPPRSLATEGISTERIELGVDAPADRVREIAARSAVTHGVDPGRLPGTWLVEVDRGRTGDLVADLVRGGANVWQVRRVSDDLDEVYRRYFEQRQEAAAGRGVAG